VTLDELFAIVSRAAWFSRLREVPDREDIVPLATVASYDGWDWLPTSREQPDPIHRRSAGYCLLGSLEIIDERRVNYCGLEAPIDRTR
jgi:hypothetical protein